MIFLKLLSDSNNQPRQRAIDLLQGRVTPRDQVFNELATFIHDCMPRLTSDCFSPHLSFFPTYEMLGWARNHDFLSVFLQQCEALLCGKWAKIQIPSEEEKV